MAEINTLVEMGFSKERAERALAVTNNKGVEPAMEWLLAHADDPMPAESGLTLGSADSGHTLGSSASGQSVGSASAPAPSASASEPEAAPSQESQSAKSLKCDECGKLFKDQTEVEYHAAKTNHSSFSESTEEKKPLTEEEKKAQLALLEERMKQKRKEREDKEKAESLEKERLRIRSGKEMQDAKQRVQELEMKKLVEQRRQEKLDEQRARERVRAQIEADKQARRLAASGQPAPAPAPAAAPTPAPAPTAAKVAYDQARIQLRLPDGRTLAQTFNAKEQLAAVRLYLQMNAREFANDASFRLMTTFPKKVFTEEDYELPLEALGLVPSSVIIVSKC